MYDLNVSTKRLCVRFQASIPKNLWTEIAQVSGFQLEFSGECTRFPLHADAWSLLKPGTGWNDGETFRSIPPTKIRNCTWIKVAHRTKTVITKAFMV